MRKKTSVANSRSVKTPNKMPRERQTGRSSTKTQHLNSPPTSPRGQVGEIVSEDLLTTGQAAALLGVRSVNTIKHWAKSGTLDGYRRGGRIVVSRESVSRLLGSQSLAEENRRRADEKSPTPAQGRSSNGPRLIDLGELRPRVMNDDEFPPASLVEAIDSLRPIRPQVQVLARKPRIIDLGELAPVDRLVDEGV